MKHKIINHEMLVVYRTTVFFRGGCIYIYILTIKFYQINSYVILARHVRLPEDDVLPSKHVAANHM